MTIEEVIGIARDIVVRADALRRARVPDARGHVGYCCVFCQSDEEYATIDAAVRSYGVEVLDTPTGRVYLVPAIPTVAGDLRILKIRTPDPSRPERGDADFSLDDYASFRDRVLGGEGFSLIRRPHVEMVELVDSAVVPGVRCYFSHPPVERHPGIREALAVHAR